MGNASVSASCKAEHCGPGGAIVAACGLALLLTPLSIRAVAAAAEAEAQGRKDDDSASSLKKLSIAELLNIEVTSVSKTAESLSDAAAAVYVITRDDILRSGAAATFDRKRSLPMSLATADSPRRTPRFPSRRSTPCTTICEA